MFPPTGASFFLCVVISTPSDGSPVAIFSGHSDEVNQVAFRPDSKQIASGSSDTTIRLWNVASGKVEAVLRGHSGEVPRFTYSPDGCRLASGGAFPILRCGFGMLRLGNRSLFMTITEIQFMRCHLILQETDLFPLRQTRRHVSGMAKLESYSPCSADTMQIFEMHTLLKVIFKLLPRRLT